MSELYLKSQLKLELNQVLNKQGIQMWFTMQ